MNKPFVWQRGGQRATPEQLAQQRQLADYQRMAGADFSPVGSVWEGLGRVANGFLGGQRMRRADAEAERNAEEGRSVIEALLAPNTENRSASVAEALANPYLDPTVRKFAAGEWERMNPKAPAPTEFERMLANAGIMPGTPEYANANRMAAERKYDPLINATLPGGNFYSGPASQLSAIMGGGDPASGAGAEAPTSQTFTGEMLRGLVSSLGPQEAESWLRRNNITVSIGTEADYNALPAGTPYIDPNGNRRVKGQ